MMKNVLTMGVVILLFVGFTGCNTAASRPETSPMTASRPEVSPTTASRPETSPTAAIEPLWDFWMDFFPNGGECKNGAYAYTEHLHPGNPFPYEIPTAEEIGIYREGYIFRYWTTRRNGSGKIYEPGSIVEASPDAPFDLYAFWEKEG